MSPKTYAPGRGIALMVAAMFCFAAMNVFVRQVSLELPTPLIVFIRNLMSLALMSTWVVHHRGRVLKTNRLAGHVWRAAIGIISMEMWFYSLSIMKLTDATALSFTTPIFITIFATLFLKEKVGPRRWAAIIAGFIGVLIILHPTPSHLNHAAWIVLISSSIMAWSSLTVKSLMNTEHPNLIVFFMTLFMTIFSAPFGIWDWQPVSSLQLFYMFLIALFSTGAHLCLTRAYPCAPLAVLMPFDFTRLIFIAIFAYMMFGEVVDGWTIAGSILIVASTVYIAHREAVHKQKITPLDVEKNE